MIRIPTARAVAAAIAALALVASTGVAVAGESATELKNGVEVTVSGKQRFVYDTRWIYYSAVAARSEGGKPTIALYADEANETVLAKSKQKKKRTEFVLVDSSHAAVPGTYYPTVTSKKGDSTVEMDNDAQLLSIGTPVSGTLTESDVVLCYDVGLDPGMSYEFTVTSESDVAVYLLISGGTPETAYLTRADAVARADKKGPGKTEKIKYTFDGAEFDWGAIVIINESGSGAYTATKFER